MTPEEQKYYNRLQISRAQEQKEKIAGRAAGKLAGKGAQAAAIASGVGAPLALAAKKAGQKIGEKVGKKAYRNRKWIIFIIAFQVFGIPILMIALTFFVIVVSTYAVVCYNPISYIASWIPWLSGLLPCS